jgi:hypothetical protein
VGGVCDHAPSVQRRSAYLSAVGWTAAGVTGAVLAAALVDALGLPPAQFAASAAAAAVLALLFAYRPAEGIGAFLLFILFAQNWQYWLDLDLRLADEGTVVLFALVGLLRRYFAVDRLRLGVKEAALAAAVAAGVVSSLINDVPLAVWGPALILFSKAIVFFYLVSWLSLTIEDLERVGLVIGGVALVVTGLGFLEYLDPAGFQELFRLPPIVQERGDLTVTRSLFLHPAMYGWLTVFASLFLYARFIVMRSWWALPLALVFNVGTVLSTRRTPLIGLVVALVTGLIWQIHRRPTTRRLLLVWTPVAGVVLVLALIFRPALDRIYRDTTEEYAIPGAVVAEILSPNPDPDVIAQAQPRLALYVGSLAIGRDQFPLGVGLGRYGSQMSRQDYSSVYREYGLDQVTGLQPADSSAVTDTFWPMVLGETGLVGMVAFAVFIGSLFVQLWRSADGVESRRHRAFALGALMLFVESLIGSSSSATYVAPPVAYFVFAAAGASLALSAPARVREQAAARSYNRDPSGGDLTPVDEKVTQRP